MKNKVFLFTSILLNILLITVLSIIIYQAKKEHTMIKEINSQQAKIDYNIDSYDNFESIFVNHNDSLYHFLWFDSYQNTPEEAYIMSCAYYYTTKKNKILKDIEQSRLQLEDIHHKKIPAMPPIVIQTKEH